MYKIIMILVLSMIVVGCESFQDHNPVAGNSDYDISICSNYTLVNNLADTNLWVMVSIAPNPVL